MVNGGSRLRFFRWLYRKFVRSVWGGRCISPWELAFTLLGRSHSRHSLVHQRWPTSQIWLKVDDLWHLQFDFVQWRMTATITYIVIWLSLKNRGSIRVVFLAHIADLANSLDISRMDTQVMPFGRLRLSQVMNTSLRHLSNLFKVQCFAVLRYLRKYIIGLAGSDLW